MMERALDNPSAFKLINDNIWTIEEISRTDFNVLVKAAEEDKLHGVFQIINWIAKEMI